MKINLKQEIKDINNEILMDQGTILHLKAVLLAILNFPHNDSEDIKDRWSVIKKITPVDEVELNDKEMTLCLHWAGKVCRYPQIYGALEAIFSTSSLPHLVHASPQP